MDRLRLLAADMVELVLPYFEKDRPTDLRPRDAVDAARAYARGQIGAGELREAGEAARAAYDVYRQWRSDVEAAWAAYAAYPVAAAAVALTQPTLDERMVAFYAKAAAADVREANRASLERATR